MIVIRNRFLPLPGYAAINLFGVLLCRRDVTISSTLLRHEQIHTRQMLEMLIVGFYVWYVVEWGVRLFLRGNAYRNISFEREAYVNMHNKKYLASRRPFAWTRYLRG